MDNSELRVLPPCLLPKRWMGCFLDCELERQGRVFIALDDGALAKNRDRVVKRN